MMKKISILLTLTILLSACSISLAEDVTPPPNYKPPTSQPQSATSGPLYPLVPVDLTNGAATYAAKCAPCHGASGKGNGDQASSLPIPPAALDSPDLARKSTPAGWYTTVTQGNMNQYMPPFNSLSDGERWNAVAFVYSLSADPARLEQGAKVYNENCASCHGSGAKGNGIQAASLSPKPRDLTEPSYVSSKSTNDFYQAITAGLAPAMPAYQDKLSDADRWATADYLRWLSLGGGEIKPKSAGQASLPQTSQTSSTPLTNTVTSAITATNTSTKTITLGTITGTVTNASGGGIPSGTEIILHGFDKMQIVVTGTTTIRADGTYEFKDVPMADGRLFMTSVSYQNASYGSNIFTAAAGVNKASLDIKVYDTTTDASALSADRLHMFLDFSTPGTVQVVELYIISNPGSKTVVASEKGGPVVKFKLPTGATNLQFQDGSLGDRYIQTEDGFADTNPVQPSSGEYQVIFGFNLPYNGKLDFQQPLNMPVGAVVLLLPEGEVSVKSSSLSDNGTRPVQDVTYRMYSGGGMQAGQTLDISISGQPGTSGSSASQANLNLILGAGALGVALIAAGLYFFWRSRQTPSQAEVIGALDEDESDAAETEFQGADLQDPDSIMDAIIALEDLHKAGELPEDAYQQRRAALKGKLKEAMGK